MVIASRYFPGAASRGKREGDRMKRLFATLSMTIALTFTIPATASTIYDLNLPGIGSQIPVISYAFDSGALTLSVTRDIDAFSPLLLSASSLGTVFSTGSLDTYDSSFSATIPATSFVMTDILISAVVSAGTNTNVTLQYATGEFVTNSVPEPSTLLLLAGAALALGTGRTGQKNNVGSM